MLFTRAVETLKLFEAALGINREQIEHQKTEGTCIKSL